MCRLYPFVFTFLTILFFSLSHAESSPIDRGYVGIYLSIPEIKDASEFNRENLESCLKNHLDYLLWYRGWSYEFIYVDSQIEMTALSKILPNNIYNYLLYIDIKASFKNKKIKIDRTKNVINYNGFIKIKINLDFINLKTSEILINNRQRQSKSRSVWVQTESGDYLKENETAPESPDFAIKRLLSESLDFIPAYPRPSVGSKISIPVKLVIDQNIGEDSNSEDLKIVEAAFDYVSRNIQNQFDFCLRITDRQHLKARNLSLGSINSLFKTLLKSASPHIDTLTVGIFRPANPENFYRNFAVPETGLSDLGHKCLLIAEPEPPQKELSEWKAQLIGQLLQHEIGHLLGAIHVSDIKSIMFPAENWVSSTLFDPLNHEIIESWRRKEFEKSSLADYLYHVAEVIDQTDYNKADIPDFFFRHLNINRRLFYRINQSHLGNRNLIINTVEAYNQFLQNNIPTAKRLFYKALMADSTQASTYYYLSRVTESSLSQKYLKNAADLGYLQAIRELGISEKD